jgi:hypothetical protein
MLKCKSLKNIYLKFPSGYTGITADRDRIIRHSIMISAPFRFR